MPFVPMSLDHSGWWLLISVVIIISFVFWYLMLCFVICQTLITEREGFPVEEQIILYAGKPLQDGYQLAKLNDLSTLDIEVRMLGGNTSFFAHFEVTYWSNTLKQIVFLDNICYCITMIMSLPVWNLQLISLSWYWNYNLPKQVLESTLS